MISSITAVVARLMFGFGVYAFHNSTGSLFGGLLVSRDLPQVLWFFGLSGCGLRRTLSERLGGGLLAGNAAAKGNRKAAVPGFFPASEAAEFSLITIGRTA